MNKVKFLSIISIGLLVSNLVLAGFMLFKKPKHPMGEGPKKMVIEKLHFDDNQVAQYEAIIMEHQKKIRASDEKILNLKNALYTTLTKENNTTQRDSLINQITNVQAEIENIHYNHFIEMKTLCKPEQQKYFEALTQEISTLFYKRQMPKQRLEK
ncbi:MAG: hypothetical protein IPG89_12165 [Bacteroidetes bacterium]|nr:hypothetical protein [Bacteroidota bacterium]